MGKISETGRRCTLTFTGHGPPAHRVDTPMIASTRAFRIEETLLEPPAINPPPTRHALFIVLISLAALLLARLSGWSDLSFRLRHVSFGTNHHAGAGLQHFCRRRDVLRDLWLPTPSTSRDMVRWLLGLRGFCLRDQKYSRVGVSHHHSFSARNFLPRSPSSISCSFPLAAFVDLSFDGCALVH